VAIFAFDCQALGRGISTGYDQTEFMRDVTHEFLDALFKELGFTDDHSVLLRLSRGPMWERIPAGVAEGSDQSAKREAPAI
jgi:hypothetical protein